MVRTIDPTTSIRSKRTEFYTTTLSPCMGNIKPINRLDPLCSLAWKMHGNADENGANVDTGPFWLFFFGKKKRKGRRPTNTPSSFSSPLGNITNRSLLLLLLLRGEALPTQTASHVSDSVLQRLILPVQGLAVLGDGLDLRRDSRKARLHILRASGVGQGC